MQQPETAEDEGETAPPPLPPIALPALGTPPADDGGEESKAAAAAADPTAYGLACYDLPPDESKVAAAITAMASSQSSSPKPNVATGVVKVKCSCPKSKCLKLYCECMSKGRYCNDDCVCKDCHNTTEYDGEGGARLEAIRYILGRKPDALNEEMRAMAREGGWEPSAKPPRKSPFQKKTSKSAKKTPVKSSAAKTVAKGKDARRKDVCLWHKMDDAESSEEETAAAIPFSTEEFPQLTLDESKDYSELAAAFTKPLFNEPSRPLEIAYSQHLAVKKQRTQAQKKKNDILQEYNQLREKFLQKKLELSLANDEVKGHTQKVGVWTRKVFELELEEPCGWNTNCKKLKEYKEEYGKLPPHAKKVKDEEEKSLSTWLDRIRCQKNQEEKEDDSEEPKRKRNKNKKFLRDYPHRLECLANLGAVWENHHETKWETMFQKLLIYKEEQGTLRFPSDDQCAATGDEELIALQKWVKSQVLTFRYGKTTKHPEIVKRLLDIGFDFEKWFAKPGKVKKEKGAKFNEIAKERVEEVDDRKMPAREEGGDDVEMKIGESDVV